MDICCRFSFGNFSASRASNHRRHDILAISRQRCVIIHNKLNSLVGVSGGQFFNEVVLLNVIVVSTFTENRGRRLLTSECRWWDCTRCSSFFVNSRDGQLVTSVYWWHRWKWWNFEFVAQMRRYWNWIHMPNYRIFTQFMVIAVAVFGLFELHSIAIRIDVALTMFAGFFDEYLLAVHGADETLISSHVATLCINVDDIIFLPLTQTLIFPFYFKIEKRN